MADIFELGTRQGVRFESNVGLLTIEDAWRLPLSSKQPGKVCLDALAVNVYGQLQKVSTLSFVAPEADNGRALLQLQFDILKHIIDVKIREREEARSQQERAEKKQQLLALIQQKEYAAWGEKSIDELQTMVAEL